MAQQLDTPLGPSAVTQRTGHPLRDDALSIRAGRTDILKRNRAPRTSNGGCLGGTVSKTLVRMVADMPMHRSKAEIPMNAAHDPTIEDLFHLEPIMAVIGMVITFCLLWFLIIFILYQLTRVALPTSTI